MSHGTLFLSVHICVRIILNEGYTVAPLSHVVTCRPERKRNIPDTRHGISVSVYTVLEASTRHEFRSVKM
jgi:hypothetical protein